MDSADLIEHDPQLYRQLVVHPTFFVAALDDQAMYLASKQLEDLMRARDFAV